MHACMHTYIHTYIYTYIRIYIYIRIYRWVVLNWGIPSRHHGFQYQVMVLHDLIWGTTKKHHFKKNLQMYRYGDGVKTAYPCSSHQNNSKQLKFMMTHGCSSPCYKFAIDPWPYPMAMAKNKGTKTLHPSGPCGPWAPGPQQTARFPTSWHSIAGPWQTLKDHIFLWKI